MTGPFQQLYLFREKPRNNWASFFLFGESPLQLCLIQLTAHVKLYIFYVLGFEALKFFRSTSVNDNISWAYVEETPNIIGPLVSSFSRDEYNNLYYFYINLVVKNY